MVLATDSMVLDFEAPEWLKTYLAYQRGDLDDNASRTYSPADIRLIVEAFHFAYHLHQGQKRKSGESYIAHPVAVAGLLRDLGADAAMVAAGFLHDVVEDTGTSPEELENQFGTEVRRLVEGVTKLSKFNFSSKAAHQAENFRRMFLAMAQDIRVLVVKLADRLHNMRTLEYLPLHKQQQIASETMDIFAPLANRLGMWKFKWELEDLSFKYLDGEAYRKIQELVKEKRVEREAQIDDFIESLRQQLTHAGLTQFDITGRPKHLHGIYSKMLRQQKEFHEIFDLYAVRVIVKSDDECYRVLAVVHQLFRPIPGRFKDYIALRKPNGYQSLHTAVIGPKGWPVEVQIRTTEMHHIAEYGIAAHWKYKEAGSHTTLKPDEEKFTWLRQLLEWENDVTDDREYLDTIRENLFESEVFVFTPNGDLIALPKGSCPVDFAYRIHSEVGNHCAGSRVSGKMVPLDTQLRNGDIVQILTQKNAHPSLDWINFVATGTARNRIRQWYKRSHRDENILRGRQALEREVGKNGFDALLKSERMQKVVERLNFSHVEDLLASLGQGETTVNSVVNKLQEGAKPASLPLPSIPLLTSGSRQESARSETNGTASKSPIFGIEGMKHHLANCCNPLPGDPILGVVTRFDRGISVHHQTCPNVAAVPGDRLIPLRWSQSDPSDRNSTYPVEMNLQVIDRVGVFNDILSRLKDDGINVRTAHVDTSPNKLAAIYLCIDIRNREQLQRTVNQLRRLADVIDLKCPRMVLEG